MLKLIVTPNNEIVRSYELSGEQELMFAIAKMQKEGKSSEEIQEKVDLFKSWDTH